MARARWLLLTGVLVLCARPSRAQDLGHKLVGLLGLGAGSQQPQGLYVADQYLFYRASELRGREGQRLPIEGLELSAFADVIGVSVTIKPATWCPYLSATVALPLSRILVSTDDPAARVDTFGLNDFYIEPLQLGWRLGRVDVIASYGLYIPTGIFEPARSVGSGQYTHQFNVGAAVDFVASRRWFASFMTSYVLNQRKLNLDLTRGDTIQIEGGVGVRLWKVLELGVTTYLLWQVRDDRGTAIPAALQGLREQAYGLGGELNVTLRDVGARITVRYAHDLVSQVHPFGDLVVVSMVFTAKSWEKSETKRAR